MTCHQKSPEDCVVCHGGKDNQSGAPPADLLGREATTFRGVGAHTSHVNGSNLADGFDCAICHSLPNQFDATGHADSELPAELTFGGLALQDGANPQWTGQTCQNTYCHGNFTLGNPGNAPTWTQVDDTQAACGTCHGLPPKGSHPSLSDCSLCHGEVVDGNFNIIDKTKHVNGVTDITAGANHSDGWTIPSSPKFYGKFIRNSRWNLAQCRQCHGTDYAGGTVGVSCLTCHQETPGDCVVCHGGIDNDTGAPPKDIDGNTATTATGVGAHTSHLSGGNLADGFDCAICHSLPNQFNAIGHADSELPAELTFGGFALQDGASPQWNGQTCQNTYCHGGFTLGNPGNTPTWTQVDGTQAACGSCHGLPPVGNHPEEDGCNLCHTDVVDASRQIRDKTKHINGSADFNMRPAHDNLFFPIFSGNHLGKWADCSDCHVNLENRKDFSCLGCHEHERQSMEKEHDDVAGFVYDSRACYSCHPNGKEP